MVAPTVCDDLKNYVVKNVGAGIARPRKCIKKRATDGRPYGV